MSLLASAVFVSVLFPKSLSSISRGDFLPGLFFLMDPSGSSPAKKLRFAPKPQPPRKPKTSTGSDDEAVQVYEARALLRNFHENVARRAPKSETKSSTQVSFGLDSSTSIRTFGTDSSTSIRTSGIAKRIPDSNDSDNDQNTLFLPSTAALDDGYEQYSAATLDAAPLREKKYKEPWDYENSYYSTTLPLRRPYSGNPELLDEEEFGQAAANKEYDENTVNSAEKLGLLEASDQRKTFFFKLPPLPLLKNTVSRKGKEEVGSSRLSTVSAAETNNLSDIPGGFMGKMLVYKSGAVKLKLGDVLCDVFPGTDVKCAQQMVLMNTAEKHCCCLGDVGERAVVVPDIETLVDSVINLE